MDITLNHEQYAALASLARAGAATPDQKRDLEQFLKEIERVNGIERYLLVVQWQEVGKQLPPTTRFPEKWPPEQRLIIERDDRAISRADVETAIAAKAVKAENILVTRDVGGLVGWTKLDDYFIT